MKKHSKTYVFVFALFIFLIQSAQVSAEPSKNMNHIINDSVSIMDFLCYRLQNKLQEKFKYHGEMFRVFEILNDVVRQNGDYELLDRLKARKKDHEKNYPKFFSANVYFDLASNRLTINCSSSHKGGTYQKPIDFFKLYWEKPIFYAYESIIMDLKKKNYRVGVVKIIKDNVIPRYEGLRGLIYKEIITSDFHYGYSKTDYDEEAIKKELIERLKIKIHHNNPIPRNLYREFSDGNWKKLELTPPKETK